MDIVVKEIPYFDPASLIVHLPKDKNFIFLDSATRTDNHSRFSFVGYDPFLILSCKDGQVEINGVRSDKSPFAALSEQLSYFHLNTKGVMPFIGGLAGYIGYECINYIETKVKLKKKDQRDLPDYLLGAFDLVIAFDHQLLQCFIYSSGFPEVDEKPRQVRAQQRIQALIDLIVVHTRDLSGSPTVLIPKNKIYSNLNYEAYCAAIKKVLHYIKLGDIYQANIAQRFECALPEALQPIHLYQQLRCKNPAPFSSYLQLEGNILASASPERFVRVYDREIVSCPIKGTSHRAGDAHSDEKLAQELLECEKNRAENLMIVDLIRNDLSRVCELHSLKVPNLFSLESYATVHHLVSTIVGKLKKDVTLIDVITATFPPGSITGAPKLRAIEIIDEIEPDARGPYCGNIGYFGFDGRMDTSVTIRTFVIKNNRLTFHVGGGIVADSKPHQEYNETLIKANALYATLTEDDLICDLKNS